MPAEQNCPHCGAPNPLDAAACRICSRALDGASPTLPPQVTLVVRDAGTPGAPAAPAPPAQAIAGETLATPAPVASPSAARATLGVAGGHAALPEGFELGHRYVVQRLLGRGGMGAVYLVQDRELGRLCALKLIRQDIAEDRSALDRFKREIHLSSQITHKNVLRVYDFGESAGLRFLTMQYVEGEDLASLMRREGRLPLERVQRLFRQICAGLLAAHEQGVIHRDLKPQNVMIGSGDQVYVTDFGLARLQAQSSMTEAGSLLGTPAYMSPEQVKGESLDHRSDIYSLGVMLYEMLSGAVPFSGGSVMEVLMRRLHVPPRPIAELNPETPAQLRTVVQRMLEVDRELRYASLEELIGELDSGVSRTSIGYGLRRARRRVLLPLGVALGLAALAGGAWWLGRHKPPAPLESAAAPRSVIVADFENKTGDVVFDGTLVPAFTVALEGASFLTSYSRSAARGVAAQLKPDATGLDESLARLIAVREGINVVTAGAVESRGGGYAVSVRAVDPVTGASIVSAEQAVAGKPEVLAAVTKLAAKVREALGDTTPESLQLAAGETFTAASLEAAHAYAVAMDLQFAGKWDEAVDAYDKVLQLDPEQGRAYAALAVVENNRGRREESERHFKAALTRIDRMSEREKYRTRGAYYLSVNRDADRAIKEFEALVQKFPADNAGLANLAVAYALERDFGKALAQARKAIAIYPRNVPQRNNVGLLALYTGDFEAAVAEQRKVLEQNPTFASAHAGLALALHAAGKRDDAIAAWQALEATGPAGASLATLGEADLALYEGRVGEAVALLQKGVAADLAADDKGAAARKLVALADAQLAAGQKPRAIASAGQATDLSDEDLVLFSAARVLSDAGEPARALALADRLGTRLYSEAQMWAELARGWAERGRRNYPKALEHLKAAGAQADSWLVRFALGETYLAAGAFTEASSELETCLKRRGEASDVFLDVVPTSRLLPPVWYELGRAHEGLGSASAAKNAYQAFVDSQSRADADLPLVAEARRKLSAR